MQASSKIKRRATRLYIIAGLSNKHGIDKGSTEENKHITCTFCLHRLSSSVVTTGGSIKQASRVDHHPYGP